MDVRRYFVGTKRLIFCSFFLPIVCPYTSEILCGITASRALVPGDLRIWAMRASSFGHAALHLRTKQLIRRFPFFHPIHDSRQPIHSVATNSASTVEHARNQEEAIEFFGCFLAHFGKH